MNSAETFPAPDDRKLTIVRTFAGPRSRVYQAWTRKEDLDRWCAPQGFTVVESAGDLRPGGSWSSCMSSPEGEEHRLSGVYLELVEDEKISFSHRWQEADGPGPETRVTVRLEDAADQTRMHFEQGDFQSAGSRDGHRGGWIQCFDRLEDFLAAR